MKNDKIKFLLCGLFFIVLAAITFRCVWPADHVFSASDLNIGRLAAMKRGLPGGLLGGFGAGPVLGVSGIASPRVFNLLLSIMPLELFANTFYGIVLVFGSASLIWFLRIWERSWMASVIGAIIAFWFNSIMLAAGGHAYKMEVLAFSVLSLCFIEKSIRSASVRRAVGFALLSGLTVGIMMIEQQDVALLAGMFIGPYAVFRLIQVHLKSLKRWVALLAPIAVVALLLSGNTITSSYKTNIKGAAAVQSNGGDNSEKWNYITQWSMVPSEWPDLIAFGWSGWSSNNPDGPYWGKIGQSAEWETTKQGFRNFKLTSVYFGVIPFLLGAYGMYSAFRNRKKGDSGVVIFWSIAGLLGLWLAFGKYSLLYKLFYHLPMVGNIRAPMKFMDNFQICLGIVSAYGIDRLIQSGKGARSVKIFWIASAVITGLLLLSGAVTVAGTADRVAEFQSMGFNAYAEIMAENMSRAWIHASILSALGTILFFVLWKGKVKPWIIAVAVVLVLSIDSVVQTSRYFSASDISSLKKGNLVTNYLKSNQGDVRSFFVDQSGIYNQWLASDGPCHGLKLFNIWQMPRMPVEYKEYLGKVGRNQIRLWELSSVKHIAAPSQVLQQLKQNPQVSKLFKPVLHYNVPTAQGMRPDVLLEFSGHIPRVALYSNWENVPLDQHCARLVSPQHNPQSTLLLASESSGTSQAGQKYFKPLNSKKSSRKLTVDVNVDTPSIVRFSQRYEPSWRVFVDGKESEVLRVDYLCMGVKVSPGVHSVVFKCVDGSSRLLFVISVVVLSLLLAVFMFYSGRRCDG